MRLFPGCSLQGPRPKLRSLENGWSQEQFSLVLLSSRFIMTDADASLELFEAEGEVSGGEEGSQELGEDEGQKVTTESRLMISKIVCRDFKSYAGVKELGPFHKVCQPYLHTHAH